MSRLFPLIAFAVLSACDSAGGNEAFRASGEVIAFSGGDGGATHACATCHGLKGEGDGHLAPRLAGLDAGYLHRQLDDYANGRRQNAEMRAVARRLSGDDRAKVSAWYAALPPTAVALPHTSTLYLQQCAGCHGPRGEGVGPANPPLAGQSTAYIEAQLNAWRSGRRGGDAMSQMLSVSRALSPPEIQLLASHADGSLPLPRHPPTQEASR